MRAFSYALSLPVKWQRWRSHHSIRNIPIPHVTLKPHDSMFCRTKVWPIKFYIAGRRIFGHFCSCNLDLDPVNFTYAYRIPGCHFRSRDKDGEHTVRSVIALNPMIHVNPIFYRTEVMGDLSFTLREYGFSTFLLLWPWPWPDDLHIRTWLVLPGDTPDVQICTS